MPLQCLQPAGVSSEAIRTADYRAIALTVASTALAFAELLAEELGPLTTAAALVCP